ncbi:MAG: aminotransferase class I/II-fold pyridoxal phosphate-dependent enzyme [Ilumatobacteraceae bacterium]
MTRRAPFLTSKLQGFTSTIFAEMSALAVRTGAINLGQGFPDYDGPAEVLDEAVDAIRRGDNQYPPGIGVPVLRQAIAEHQQRFSGLTYDPDSEVLVTVGATEALAGALLGLCEVGDEVLVLEPTYDSYQACIALAGAVPRFVTLRPPPTTSISTRSERRSRPRPDSC